MTLFGVPQFERVRFARAKVGQCPGCSSDCDCPPETCGCKLGGGCGLCFCGKVA